MQAFKEQTAQYKQVYEASKVSSAADGQLSASLKPHPVVLKLQNVKVPLNGDMAAIKKYAQEMEQIKAKVSDTKWQLLRYHPHVMSHCHEVF